MTQLNCSHIEPKLAAFLAGELDRPAEAEVISAHVASCEQCQASVAMLREIEKMLELRSNRVPDARQFLNVAKREMRAYQRRRRIRKLVSVPALVLGTATMVVLAFVLKVPAPKVSATELGGLGGAKMPTVDFSGWVRAVAEAIVSFGNGDPTNLMVMVGGLTVIILLTMTWVTYRFLHE